MEPKNKRKGLRFGGGGSDLGLGDRELPRAVGTRHPCSCSISVTLVLPHKGFITGPVTSEDVCEKVGKDKPPVDAPVAEGQVLKRVVAPEIKPSRWVGNVHLDEEPSRLSAVS